MVWGHFSCDSMSEEGIPPFIAWWRAAGASLELSTLSYLPGRFSPMWRSTWAVMAGGPRARQGPPVKWWLPAPSIALSRIASRVTGKSDPRVGVFDTDGLVWSRQAGVYYDRTAGLHVGPILLAGGSPYRLWGGLFNRLYYLGALARASGYPAVHLAGCAEGRSADCVAWEALAWAFWLPGASPTRLCGGLFSWLCCLVGTFSGLPTTRLFGWGVMSVCHGLG